MTPPPDPYAVLGVDRDATQAEITTAYRRLVRTLHPDAQQPDPDRLNAVLAAYQLLRDPQRRAAYDRDHPRRSGTQQPSRTTGTRVNIRVHQKPDLRAGPVRRHPH